MQNETKLSAEMINSLFQMLKRGKDGQENVRSILNKSLSDSQKQTLGQIMSDPQKMKELLSSPEVKELLKKFGGSGESNDGSA